MVTAISNRAMNERAINRRAINDYMERLHPMMKYGNVIVVYNNSNYSPLFLNSFPYDWYSY